MELGGQAVIEGVMMRNKERFAVAVRLKNGKIKIKREKSAQFPKIFNFFFVRGIVGLGYTLYDGLKALSWSSNQQLEEEEKISKKELILTLLASLGLALFLFVGLPFFLAWLLHAEGFLFNFLDGIFRLLVFLIYLLLISKMKDVKVLFQYHGAEHKTIAAYEAGERLIPKNMKKYSRFHPRCGTSFLFIVLLLSIILFTLISGAWWVKLLARIVLLPVIAGISYEFIKFSNKHRQNHVCKVLIAPGLWLQKLTTREPTEKQLEVAIKALLAVK